MEEKIGAIIPAYNEEKHIGGVVEATKKQVNFVIVVDNASKDNTFKKAKKAGAIVIKHPTNLGKGASLRTGIERAIQKKADIIITLDADFQHSPSEIPKLVKALKTRKLDLVIGGRSLSGSMPFVFRVGNFVLNIFFSLLFGTRVTDVQSGFRAFNSEIYEKIKWKSNDYRAEAEMLANLIKNKLKCDTVSIQTRYLEKYKGTTPLDGFKIFLGILRWRFS